MKYSTVFTLASTTNTTDANQWYPNVVSDMNTNVVTGYLDKEASLGRIIHPVPPSVLPMGTQISPVGVMPKSGQLEKMVANSGSVKLSMHRH